MKIKHLIATALGCLLSAGGAHAQLSTNPDKFLGNITTDWPGSMNYDGFIYSDYWNQGTPENGSKWSTVEGTRGSYYWAGADPAFNYANQKGFPFKFHTLVWGSQYPGWIKNLSATERYKAIESWMDKVKSKYPKLEMIDVVNEAVEGHQADTYLMREALGGNGESGYDWIVKAFEMAHERWPEAILIYNDFNTFQWNTDQFIGLVRSIRDAGAPIDAYGCQSHDLGGMTQANFQAAMTKIQNALKIPMYITEYDIGDTNDANQKWNFQQHIPVMWEADYCAGVTLWGWFYGHTWIKDEKTGEGGISGLIKDNKERSALTWLRDYMKTDKAKTAKSPFPGMKKEASVYVRPARLKAPIGEETIIEVRASMRTKTIDHIDLYAGSKLIQTMTEAPYIATYTPTAAGRLQIKAVVTTTDGGQYERLSAVTGFKDLGAHKFTSLAELTGGEPFMIIDEQNAKALYGTDNQNLGFADYNAAVSTTVAGYQFRLVSLLANSDASIRKYYMLRLLTPGGEEYNIWGSPGYLNTQPVNGTCSFILGLSNQNGQDIKNGAVWDIQYVASKGFSLKNIGTGKYLHDNGPAKYDEPQYFTFCTEKVVTAVDNVKACAMPAADNAIYSLHGVKVGIVDDWDTLPHGLYIMNGKKLLKP